MTIEELDKAITYAYDSVILHLNREYLKLIKEATIDPTLSTEENAYKFFANIGKKVKDNIIVIEGINIKDATDLEGRGLVIFKQMIKIYFLLQMSKRILISSDEVHCTSGYNDDKFLYRDTYYSDDKFLYDKIYDKMYDLEDQLITDFHKAENIKYFNQPMCFMIPNADGNNNLFLLFIEPRPNKCMYTQIIINMDSNLISTIYTWQRYNMYDIAFEHYDIDSDIIIPCEDLYVYVFYNCMTLDERYLDYNLRPRYKFDYTHLSNGIAKYIITKQGNIFVVDAIDLFEELSYASITHSLLVDYINKHDEIKAIFECIDNMSADSKTKLAKKHLTFETFDPNNFKYKK